MISLKKWKEIKLAKPEFYTLSKNVLGKENLRPFSYIQKLKEFFSRRSSLYRILKEVKTKRKWCQMEG